MKRLILLILYAIAALTPLMAQKSVDLSMGTGVKVVEVTNKGLAFDVTEIKVKLGDTVRITYTNGGGTHDLVIDEFDAGTKVIRSNQSETFEFTASEAGEFVFYCSVGNHRERGMWGTLVVVN